MSEAHHHLHGSGLAQFLIFFCPGDLEQDPLDFVRVIRFFHFPHDGPGNGQQPAPERCLNAAFGLLEKTVLFHGCSLSDMKKPPTFPRRRLY
jgi:hypothetical protein